MQPQQMDFSGHKIQLVRRARQRSIRLTIKPDGQLRISTAKSTSQKEIQQFLQSHQAWIESTLKKVQAHPAHKSKRFEEGEVFLLRGRPFLLRLVLHSKSQATPPFEIIANEIRLNFLPNESISIVERLRTIYRGLGERWLSEAVRKLAAQTNLLPQKVVFRAQKSLWGSCSARGVVSLNWKLAFAPPEVLEYVVLHELVHLEVRNHSKFFWQKVAEHCPDHRRLRRWLRQHQHEVHFL